MKPHLRIRKKIVAIQGKERPCAHIQAVIDPAIQAVLSTYFANEPLFKRTMFQGTAVEGSIQPTPALAPHLSAFLKSDACPEIMVKTILAGQLYQASGIWDLKCFEFVAERAFDGLADMMNTIAELGDATLRYAPGGYVEVVAEPVPVEALGLPEGATPEIKSAA